MKRILIVNADDCNLTPAVTRAILDCHDRGILSSTTFMVNLAVAPETVKALLARQKLGVGIHLNVTLGEPVSPPAKVASLLERNKFKKLGRQITVLPKESELIREYQSQIDRFIQLFKREPTHLDTHHQVHDLPFFYEAIRKVALRNELPVRRSQLMRSRTFLTVPGLKSRPGTVRNVLRVPDYFFGNLTVEGYWRPSALETILRHLPEGVSEIMCHPGIVDQDLRTLSSFTSGREAEYRLFRSPALRKLLSLQGISLSHFGNVL